MGEFGNNILKNTHTLIVCETDKIWETLPSSENKFFTLTMAFRKYNWVYFITGWTEIPIKSTGPQNVCFKKFKKLF